MKKILITGKNGFLAKNLAKHLSERGFDARLVSVRGGAENIDLRGIDCIVHTAAISSDKKGVPYSEYKRVNVETTRLLAQRAKECGVQHFVFLSSLFAMFDTPPKISSDTVLGENSPCTPQNFYGKSKHEAEKALEGLAAENFKIAVVRPPIIYGEGGAGNYALLKKIALKLPVLPDIENRKSMIYVGNLCELIKLIIENQSSGLFLPQNAELVSTKEMMGEIAKANGKKAHFSKLFGLGIKLFGNFVPQLRKAFGNLYYAPEQSNYFGGKYRIFGFAESIRRTESGAE